MEEKSCRVYGGLATDVWNKTCFQKGTWVIAKRDENESSRHDNKTEMSVKYESANNRADTLQIDFASAFFLRAINEIINGK